MDLPDTVFLALKCIILGLFVTFFKSFKVAMLFSSNSIHKEIEEEEDEKLKKINNILSDVRKSSLTISLYIFSINCFVLYTLLIFFLNNGQGFSVIFSLSYYFLYEFLTEYVSNYIGMKYKVKLIFKNIKFVNFLVLILGPVFSFFDKIVIFFTKFFYKEVLQEEKAATEDDLKHLVEEIGSDVIEDTKKEMINNVFEFHDLKLNEVMTHRTEIVSIEMSQASLNNIIELAIESGHSRIPIYEDNLDNIIGVLYVKDALVFLKDKDNSFDLKKYMRKVMYVPETSKCQKLFDEFCLNRVQMAIAVDEYGGTSGLITMEDLIEVIVGNIEDEYDEQEEGIQKVGDNEYIVEGSYDILDLCIETGLSTSIIGNEKDHVNTVAGFILDELGHVPNADDIIEFKKENGLFKVMAIEDNRIKSVQVKIEKNI